MVLRIVMHEAFPPEDVEAALRVARECDATAEVSPTYATKAIDPVLIVVLFVGGPFASGFLGKAGEDAWDALKGLVTRLRADLRTRSQILVEDDAGIQLVLGPASPADALTVLPDDIQAIAGDSGQLAWDDEARAWKAPW